jgi:hypothetical protein
MRLWMSLCILLTACASHVVRCDSRLQPINNPKTSAATIVAPRSAP